MEQLETWQFGANNDELVELVLEGKKTATTCLNNIKVPKVGERSILTFENEKKACIVETKNVIITKFKDVTPKMAYLEGEGDRSLGYYIKTHIDYFKTINPDFNDDTEVIFEVFEVVEDLRKTRLANKYVIKICANNKEDEFEKESRFYIQNCSSKHIPKLYKYDNTKNIINSVYEIIEKIEGKSLYYYWYKMNENEREETIKELINILKEVHKSSVDETYDWAKYVKEKVLNNYEKVKNYFSAEEQQVIEKSFNEYDKYLSENQFAFIHNDLHFDNIIKNENGLFLIDFNDAMVAPIDYEFRILYMCKDTPCKWANIEMDPYQKSEDYKNIDIYIKKYYENFSKIEYIDKRMIIYKVLNDIGLLSRFDKDELKNNVLKYSRELIK